MAFIQSSPEMCKSSVRRAYRVRSPNMQHFECHSKCTYRVKFCYSICHISSEAFRVKHFEWIFTFKVLHIEWNQNIVTNNNLTRVSKMKHINQKRYYIFLNETIFLHVLSIQSYKCNHFKVFLETMKYFLQNLWYVNRSVKLNVILVVF